MSTGPARPLRRILAATDGEPRSDGALRFADRLAARDGALVEIATVFTPRYCNLSVDRHRPELRCRPRDRRAAADQFGRVWAQARERLHLPWPIVFRAGYAPAVIAELARSGGFDLVVVGRTDSDDDLRKRRRLAEAFVYTSDAPIVAVPSRDAPELPHVAVVSLDTDSTTAETARVAAMVVGAAGVLHTTPQPSCRELLALCAALGADLVALHLPGHSLAVRTLMGGLVSDVLRRACCAVLVVPTRSHAEVSGAGDAVSGCAEVAETTGTASL